MLRTHEQGLGHMGKNYALTFGKLAIILVISGPDTTNVTTLVANIFADGISMIIPTSQISISVIETGAYQEADILRISKHCIEWNIIVKNVDELSKRINQAFVIAISERPAPVPISFFKNITTIISRKPILLKYTIPKNLDNHLLSIFYQKTLTKM
ncbi:uncharacterized protein PWA37_001260 [Arxiozyma heterogenica]|uniref:Thiamine pyrophosphate enzyme N-terminal TPP-binding domain-containing protein n=1 Tax=Arxiozyma heterogenica TaxID=278026 RepID=A0AAN8A7K0_9SACH|nr:hypothetical protein RI543_003766 [Kazachstania heterogenica]